MQYRHTHHTQITHTVDNQNHTQITHTHTVDTGEQIRCLIDEGVPLDLEFELRTNAEDKERGFGRMNFQEVPVRHSLVVLAVWRSNVEGLKVLSSFSYLVLVLGNMLLINSFVCVCVTDTT